jgi:hypothetical protein
MDVELVVDLGLFKTNPCDFDLGCGPITKRDPALDFHIAMASRLKGALARFDLRYWSLRIRAPIALFRR